MNNNTLSIQKEISEIIFLHEKGLFKEALKKTDALSDANPNNALIFNAYGIIYASLENFEKSVDFFSKAINLEPEYIKAHNNLGSVLTHLGRFEEASRCYAKVVKLEPNFAEAHFDLGKSLNIQGKLEESIHSYTKAIELKPNYTDARTDLIKILTYHNPKKENLNSYVLTNKLLQSTNLNFNAEQQISDGDITDFFRRCNDIVVENINNLNTEEVQIYRRNIFKFNCERHLKIFDTYNVIPENCFGCYKVQIELKTVMELFKLYFVFDNLNLKNNNHRKCMIEFRTDIPGAYKGYVYCFSLGEANNIETQLKQILEKTIVKNFIIKVKRGCSEFGIAYPEYKDPKKNMKYNEDWRGKEKIIDEELIKKDHSAKIVLAKSLTGTTIRDILIMRNWLSYAKKVGDLSYKKIFEKTKISSVIEKRLSDQLSQRSREFEYVS